MRLLGIDYGRRYVGLALAEDDFVSPLKVLSYCKDNDVIANSTIVYISQIIKRENIDEVIVGMPMLNGKETTISPDVREFTNKLRKKSPKTTFKFVDESYTSKKSIRDMISFGIAREKRSQDHAFSANALLKRYLNIE